MNSFIDPFTPLPPYTDIPQPPPGVGVWVQFGSFYATIPTSPVTIQEIITNIYGPTPPSSCGVASALMVQEIAPSGETLFVYYWEGAAAMSYPQPDRGPNASPSPFFIATNRSQIDNLELASSGGGLTLNFQFFVGNPNVSL